MTREKPRKEYESTDKFVGDADDLTWYEVTPASEQDRFSAKDYAKALCELKLTKNQRAMLRIHYAAPGHTITARQLAVAMGYNSWRATNMHYGRLGRLVGEKLGLPPDTKLEAICAFHKAPGKEWEFIQRPNLVSALESLGIVSGAHAPMQEEVPAIEPLAEGAAYTVQVNAYERNDKARTAAIQHHGVNCGVCGFKFADVYGPAAENYIQVHHLRPLASIKQEYRIDPIQDLLPVCANCHAVIHLRNPPFTPAEVKAMLGGKTQE